MIQIQIQILVRILCTVYFYALFKLEHLLHSLSRGWNLLRYLSPEQKRPNNEAELKLEV